jgi:hypothetical protein
VPYTKRWHWLQEVTGETTIRGAARAAGVTHPTIQRWLKGGAPIRAVIDLTVKFECDLIEALVVWGHLDDGDVAKLNYAALMKYVPGEVLTGEVHARYVDYMSKKPDPYRKTTVGMLRRA